MRQTIGNRPETENRKDGPRNDFVWRGAILVWLREKSPFTALFGSLRALCWSGRYTARDGNGWFGKFHRRQRKCQRVGQRGGIWKRKVFWWKIRGRGEKEVFTGVFRRIIPKLGWVGFLGFQECLERLSRPFPRGFTKCFRWDQWSNFPIPEPISLDFPAWGKRDLEKDAASMFHKTFSGSSCP